MNIQTMLQDPESEVRDIAREVRSDPFLATEILKVAAGLKNLRNPSSPPIESIEHAVTYIGRKTLSDIVLAVSIKGFSVKTQLFNVDSFWNESFQRASISEWLVGKLNIKVSADDAYLAGCLANIGKLISAMCYPEETDKIYETVHGVQTMTNWIKAEKAYPRCNHQILGEVASALWGLPEYILQVCRYHHRNPKLNANPERNLLVEVVALANIMNHWLALEPAQVEEDFLNSLLAYFKLSYKEFERLIDESSHLRQQFNPIMG
jgi:HD-like signal output (HDOD) protein